MERDDIGVHANHCCYRCGWCKYWDQECPVVTGEVKQEYPCMDCPPEDDTPDNWVI